MKNPASVLLSFCIAISVALINTNIQGDTVSPDSGIKLQKGADYQIVKEYQYPDFKIIQFNLARLSHFSYMLISDAECMVVDPGRDAAIYQEIAKKAKVKIKAVFLTHAHADFIAGHLELAALAGCPVYVNQANDAVYSHKGLKDGDILNIGKVTVKFIETPGHTPDGMCALVYDTKNSQEPEVVFTGDTLFVGSVGRPDLLEGKMSAVELAAKMYDSWFKKLALLGDNVVVLPAHGAGSLCGSNLGNSPSSTIGAEKKTNPYLQHKSKNEFIAAILNSLDHAPQYFGHDAALNRQGPPLVDWKKLPGQELTAAAVNPNNPNTYIVDVREAEQYAAGHIENAINIPASGKMATWVGIVVPWGSRLVITGSPEEIKEAAHRLQRIGYTPEYITLEQWQKSGKKLFTTEIIPPKELYAQFQQGKSPMILDVRKPSEWNTERIGDVINMPLQTLHDTQAKLNPSEPMITVCNTGYRAGIAAGLLARSGFKDIKIMKGGMEEWRQGELPTVGSGAGCAALTTAAANTQRLNLPEVITTDGLNRLIKDQPDFIEIIDIRPAGQFADYNIPASRNIELKTLFENGVATKDKTLIIVDRDGTLAFIAAGILAEKMDGRIKALEGGIENYWRKTFAADRPAGLPQPPPSIPAEKKPQIKQKPIQDAGC